MLYLDYSATTPVNKEVLDSFCKVSLEYPGNANSLHKLGVESKKLMDKAEENILSLLKLSNKEVVFTSSASEANNMVLKSVAYTFKNRGKHIISTELEHSSTSETLKFLEKNGYEISYVKLLDDGSIDLDDLKKLIRKDTIIVSICHVNSEVGILQDLNEISKIIKSINPLCYFHADATQSVGKIEYDFNLCDFITFSAHKIYGLKGIACLIKNKNIVIESLIHGGKSQSNYRSGTPAVSLMVSFSKALRLSLDNIDNKYQYVSNLNKILKNELSKIDGVVINSLDNSIPHILNISIIGIKPETMLHALEEHEIYISTKTACSKTNSDSSTLTALKKDKSIASSSIRISLSHLTKEDEIYKFIEIFKKLLNDLKIKN